MFAFLTTERAFAYGRGEQMYATRYSARPIHYRRTHRGSASAIRWLVVLIVVGLCSLALARVALGGSPAADTIVVVQPGDTLWSIAANRYPTDDVRVRVEDIEQANGLQSPIIEVGQTLRLPG